MTIITKETAQLQKLKFYFTGLECRNGHTAERFTSNSLCLTCVLNRRSKYQDAHQGRMKTLQKEWYTKNRDQVIEKSKQWNSENSESFKENNCYNKRAPYFRQRKYGLTEVEYVELYNNADNKCQICKQPETSKDNKGSTKALAIDHCHETNKVRGILCQRCNTSLGGFKDSIELLSNAINYLTKK